MRCSNMQAEIVHVQKNGYKPKPRPGAATVLDGVEEQLADPNEMSPQPMANENA